MGGDLGGLEGRPPKFEVGETAHASVPPILGEVVLLKAYESSKMEKRCNGEIVLIK